MILVRVSVAGWPPSGKGLLIWLTESSLCIMFILSFVFFRFGFEGGTVGFVESVLGHC